MRRAWAGVGVLFVLLVVLFWFGPREAAAPAPAPSPLPVQATPTPSGPPTWTAPPPPEAPPSGPPAGSIADAHRRIAERLGLITIRCYVGPEFDGLLYPGFYYRPDVEDGWFTALVEEPEGRRPVSIMTLPEGVHEYDPYVDATFEEPFEVRWSAGPGQVEAPCTVEAIRTAVLVVDVVDRNPDSERYAALLGEPPDATVHGCGGYTGGRGTLRMEVKVGDAEGGCTLEAYVLEWTGRTEVAPLSEGEERRVTVVVDTLPEPEDGDEVAELEASIAEVTEEAATLEALLDELPQGSAGREKVARMREHRLGMAERSEARLQRLEEQGEVMTAAEVLGDLPDAVIEELLDDLEGAGNDVDGMLEPGAPP